MHFLTGLYYAAGLAAGPSPSPGALTLVGYAPTVVGQQTSITPATGSVAVAGQAAAKTVGGAPRPSAGAAVLTGGASSLRTGAVRTPQTGGAVLFGGAADIAPQPFMIVRVIGKALDQPPLVVMRDIEGSVDLAVLTVTRDIVGAPSPLRVVRLIMAGETLIEAGFRRVPQVIVVESE